MAPRIRARAIRRCGELLREIEPAWASRFQCTEPGGSVARTRSQTARPSMRFIADLGEHGLEPRTTLVESPRATACPKPSCAQSSATTSGSVLALTPQRSCAGFRLGSPTTTRFTPQKALGYRSPREFIAAQENS